jgi:CubicO group peptidase (beta-lactamase class C family)
MSSDLQPSSPEAVGLSSAGLDRVDAVVQNAIEKHQIAGAVTLVARHGKVVRTRVMGVDHRLPRKALAEDTIFHIFSMTKPVTGLAMSILADRGLWKPEDPIAKHLPEFAGLRVLTGYDKDGTPMLDDVEHAPTMLELMTHRAGFGYGQDKSRPETRLYKKIEPLKAPTLDEFIARMATLPLAYQPGSRWQYSVSMDIQGAIVERLTGRKYADFLREEVFEPLGMTDTAFFVPPTKRKRLARLHLSIGPFSLLPAYNFLFPDHFAEPGAAYGGMGLYSTAGDYAKFAQLLLNKGEWDGKRIVSEKALEAQMTNYLPEAMLAERWDAGHMHFRPGFGYGYNGTVVYDPVTAELPVGAGTYFWDGAAGTWFWVDPENDLLYVGMVQIFSYTAAPLQALTQTAMAGAIQ